MPEDITAGTAAGKPREPAPDTPPSDDSVPVRWSAAPDHEGMWMDMAVDPRFTGTGTDTDTDTEDEKSNLVGYLRSYRITMEMKCADLTAEQLARQSVPPSTMSLLGLVRHMADVERQWFRRVLAGQDAPPLYWSDSEQDRDWLGAVADPEVVATAWRDWRAEVAFAEVFVAEHDDLSVRGTMRGGDTVSMRDVLVHMIEEYARHCGHADLIRERIDGRVGQ